MVSELASPKSYIILYYIVLYYISSSCHQHPQSSIILSSNKIQHGDILVPANPGAPGKVAVKTKRDFQ